MPPSEQDMLSHFFKAAADVCGREYDTPYRLPADRIGALHQVGVSDFDIHGPLLALKRNGALSIGVHDRDKQQAARQGAGRSRDSARELMQGSLHDSSHRFPDGLVIGVKSLINTSVSVGRFFHLLVAMR
jgi:zinc transporter ZupT